VEDVEVKLENCLNVEPIVSPLSGTLEVGNQLEEKTTPSKLSQETPLETETVWEEIPIEIDREVGVDTSVTMAQEGGGMDPLPVPPIDPIDQLVRPRGLPILVPQNLAAEDMPSHLPKFYGIKDENPSKHMERYIKRAVSFLVTNPGYWLVWFLTTLESEIDLN
jgi:hypothetical protein